MVADIRPSIYTDDADLEHGWAPTTPLTDTVQRQSVLALAESTARPSEAMGAHTIRGRELIASHLGRPAGYWNAAVVTRPLDRAGWDGVLEDLTDLEAAASDAGPAAVDLWSPFPTPDLRGDGWRLAGHPVAMWRPPTGADTGADAARATTLAIERVTDERGIDEWGRTAVDCYPLDADPTAIASPALLAAGDVHLFIGRAAGEPVAAAATVVANECNAVALITTHPDARGRGYGRAITWAATTVRPTLPATLLASDEGRPLYEDLGYLPHSRWTMWIRPHR